MGGLRINPPNIALDLARQAERSATQRLAEARSAMLRAEAEIMRLATALDSRTLRMLAQELHEAAEATHRR